jgi:Ca-activated chloride channel homolog
MKTILDRHAEHLTPDERRVIWERVAGGRRPQRAVRVWRLAPVMATLVAGAFALVLGQRPHERTRPAAPAPRAVSVPAPAVALPSVVQPGGRSTIDSHRGSEGDGPSVPRVPLAPPRVAVERVTVLPELALARASAEADSSVALATGPRTVTAPVASPPPVGAGPGTIEGRVIDARTGKGIPYASVAIPAAKRGALTDVDGRFRIERVPAGTYSLKVQSLGYRPVVMDSLGVGGDVPVAADVAMNDVVVREERAIEVMAQRPVDTKSSTTRQSVSADALRQLPVDHLLDVTAIRGGVVAPGGELRFRGGRAGEAKAGSDGAATPSSALAGAPIPATGAAGVSAPPVIPTTGGTRLPNDQAFDSMFFREHGVNPFIATDEDPLSTFAVDVDAASYTLTRRYLELGQLPPAPAVRVEEFINFFRQGYPRFEDEDFRIVMDGAPSPFGAGYQLLRVGIKGREIAARDRRPAQLTFVIDVSGSMAREDRLELVKRALRLLVDQLHDDDRVGIVVYGSAGRVVLEPAALGGPTAHTLGMRPRWGGDTTDEPAWRGSGRERLLDAIERLHPEGATNAEEGLRLGYEMARRAFRSAALNRIVLCSDGVANVGRTGPESILASVRTEAERGISLTTIGFGMGNYNDALMEQLADQGDGNHYYVDDLGEARRVFVENLTGTLQTIAKDAKVQVEFDSTRVLRYRLLGFEDRDVADRDFRNDRVDAGEIGAGHEVTALYEVKLAPHAAPGPLATVRLRYARPEHEGAGAPRVRELEQRFETAQLGRRFEEAAPRFRLDAAVAEFAEILRGSYWAKEGRLSDVLAVARGAARELGDPPSAELVKLVEKAAALSARGAKPGAGDMER